MRVALLSKPDLDYDALATYLDRNHSGYTWRPWGYSNGEAEDLCEFAGRLCYQSFTSGRGTDAYFRHIIEGGHLSILEHASYTFLVTDVSRSLTHELVRHRHLSFSQLSQRFVEPAKDDVTNVVMPPLVEDAGDGLGDIYHAMEAIVPAYHSLVEKMEAYLQENRPHLTSTQRRKQAREAARCVLANCTPTQVVVSGNVRAWRHFLRLRGAAGADAEICKLSVEVYRILHMECPRLLADFSLLHNVDGHHTLTTPYAAG